MDAVHVVLRGDSTTLNVFGLTSDGANVQTIQSIRLSETNRSVEFSIYYNMIPPETVSYPFDFNLTMDISVSGRASGSFQFISIDGLAKGRIDLQAGRAIYFLQVPQWRYLY